MKCAEQKLQVDQTINAIQIKSEESVASIETFCGENNYIDDYFY